MGVLAFIKAIPTMAKTVKFWVIVVALASAIGGVVYFVNDYRDTLQELAVAEQRVTDLEGKVNKVNDQIESEKKRTQQLRNANDKISSEYLNSVRELNQLKAKYEDLIENPDENELKIEASFNNFMNDISCITGDSTQCQTKTTSD
jgi:chromosome segregation ATPase